MTKKRPAHEALLGSLKTAIENLRKHHIDMQQAIGLRYKIKSLAQRSQLVEGILFTCKRSIATDQLNISQLLYFLAMILWPNRLVAEIVQEQMRKILTEAVSGDLAEYLTFDIEELVRQVEYLEQEESDGIPETPGA
jgi:hypothetical protein